MRALGLLVIVALVGVVFLYVRQTGGAPADGGGLGNLLNIFKGVGEGAAANAKPWWDELYAQPWFWTAAVSITGAGIGIKFWRSLGGFGKGCVIVALAVAATVLVVKFG